MKTILFTMLTILSVTCISQEEGAKTTELENQLKQHNASQIGHFVVAIFQESQGNLLFGTLE